VRVLSILESASASLEEGGVFMPIMNVGADTNNDFILAAREEAHA
jgi:hypothetical protein